MYMEFYRKDREESFVKAYGFMCAAIASPLSGNLWDLSEGGHPASVNLPGRYCCVLLSLGCYCASFP